MSRNAPLRVRSSSSAARPWSTLVEPHDEPNNMSRSQHFSRVIRNRPSLLEYERMLRRSSAARLAVILVISCGGDPTHAEKSACPPTPDDFGVAVRKRISNGRLFLSLRDDWTVRGGEFGDQRSATGNMLPGDDELRRELFCLLLSHKMLSASERERPCTDQQASLEIWPSSEFRTNGAESILSCDPVAERIGEVMEAQLGSRLPAATVRPIREYMTDPPSGCRSVSDFEMTLFSPTGRPRMTIASHGEFQVFGLSGSIRSGTLPREAFETLICELARYDFTALHTNAEGRRDYCPELTRPGRLSGRVVYRGIAIDLRLRGQTTRLRVGHCDPPLDLYRFLDTIRTKVFLYAGPITE